MDKVLSIIIPSYNMKDYIAKCVESLICEVLTDLDVIIVNDGSRDETLQIAQSFAQRYPDSISVINKENGNYGSCINAALKVAQGKYVKVLDADDSFNTSQLPDFVTFLKNVKTSVVVSDYVIVNEQGETTETITFSDKITDKILSFRDATAILGHEMFQMHAVTYKLNLLKQIGYKQTEGISYTDQEWMFTPMALAESISVYPGIIYKYLVGRAGQTIDTNVSYKAVNQTMQVMESLMVRFKELQSSIDGEQRNYLISRLYQKIPSIYRISLLKTIDNAPRKRLRSFDENLMSLNNEIYGQLDNETVGKLPYHFISHWRKSGRQDGPLFLAFVRLIISKLLLPIQVKKQ